MMEVAGYKQLVEVPTVVVTASVICTLEVQTCQVKSTCNCKTDFVRKLIVEIPPAEILTAYLATV